MRRFAFLAPLAVTLAVAGAVQALPNNQPGRQAPEVTVTIGADLQDEVVKLGQRDVTRQVDQLAEAVRNQLAGEDAYAGARVNLVLTDLKPNRPTFQQAADTPGLSIMDSISIGGATIEGEIITAEGERLPVRYSRYSNSLADVYGYGTWQDAERAYDRLAANIVAGRLVTR